MRKKFLLIILTFSCKIFMYPSTFWDRVLCKQQKHFFVFYFSYLRFYIHIDVKFYTNKDFWSNLISCAFLQKRSFTVFKLYNQIFHVTKMLFSSDLTLLHICGKFLMSIALENVWFSNISLHSRTVTDIFFHLQIALMFKQINFILCFSCRCQQFVEKHFFIRKVLYVEQKISHQIQSCILIVEISVLFCRILCEQEKLCYKNKSST